MVAGAFSSPVDSIGFGFESKAADGDSACFCDVAGCTEGFIPSENLRKRTIFFIFVVNKYGYNLFSRKYITFGLKEWIPEYDCRETGRNLPASLCARRTFGHAAQRVAPEQQLSVLDVAFVAWEGEIVFGFVPVEITDGGIAKINNYYVSGDDPRLIARFLQEIVRCYHRDYTIRSVTLTRHAEVFRAEGFVPVREWKEYVAMEYGKNRRP